MLQHTAAASWVAVQSSAAGRWARFQAHQEWSENCCVWGMAGTDWQLRPQSR